MRRGFRGWVASQPRHDVGGRPPKDVAEQSLQDQLAGVGGLVAAHAASPSTACAARGGHGRGRAPGVLRARA
eukprot:11218557-Lingulodinium_polyedra.AAC.1